MYTTYANLQADLAANRTTVLKTVEDFLVQIENQKDLNVFLEVYAQEALQRAAEVDLKIKNGTAGKLAGMVIGIKDVFAYQNHRLQASSKILEGFKSQYTATAIQRLLDQDAIIIGSQNCDEFAMGSSNQNSAFGPTLNAADKTRVPGGSSGASAVAVQAGLCHASIGSDTGGSVRQPAAFCGVVGFKPTYGRISRWGLAAYASSFDCVGPIANSVEDIALLLEIMAGPDDYDSTAIQAKNDVFYPVSLPDQAQKIGYLKEALESNGLDPEVKSQTLAFFEKLKEAGHTIVPLDFPEMKYLLPTYYILTMAEASSNLSRYDGIRYGYRNLEAKDLNEIYKKTRAEGFGKEVKKRIILGSFILSADYYDAYYTKALRVRNLIKQKTEKFFDSVNFIVSPTTPSPAFKLGEVSTDPISDYLMDIFTVHANVVGNPAISLPIGSTKGNLPIGIQFLAPQNEDLSLLKFSNSLGGLK
jgi:aspartyl-tRNA(Asn)/glutamyl-tRNA(Gln) amidotransferase subunit A